MITCIVCGSNKVKNRETKLCATHSRERRKAESTPAPKPRKALRQVSEKMQGRQQAKNEAFAIVTSKSAVCAACGPSCRAPLTPSHILTTKKFPQHEANPLNLQAECWEGHCCWENNKRLAFQLHVNWQHKMEVMALLEPAYFEEFKSKYPDLF